MKTSKITLIKLFLKKNRTVLKTSKIGYFSLKNAFWKLEDGNTKRRLLVEWKKIGEQSQDPQKRKGDPLTPQ